MRCAPCLIVFLSVSFFLVQTAAAQTLPKAINFKTAPAVVDLFDLYVNRGDAAVIDYIDFLKNRELKPTRDEMDLLMPHITSLSVNRARPLSDFASVVYRRLNFRESELRKIRTLRSELDVDFGLAVDAFPRPGHWPIYDTSMFYDKPDVYAQGLKPVEMVGACEILGEENLKTPNREWVQRVARTLPTDRPVCFDIEHWPMHGPKLPETIAKLVKISKWIRQANPDVKFGFYGVLPQRDYWAIIHYRVVVAAGDSMGDLRRDKYLAQYANFQAANASMAELGEAVDYIFPSLYTFYTKQDDWVTFAEESIAAAKQYGKPIIPFLMPAYHPSNDQLRGQPIGRDYWRIQLRTVRQHADGLIVWMAPIRYSHWSDWKWWYNSLVRTLADDLNDTALAGVDVAE